MNFISNLAKGFIRSAVNQVGKDGGKVISNRVYGNQHSTPVRDTSTFYTGELPEAEDQTISKEELIQEGYRTELFGSGFFMYFFLILGCSVLVFVGPAFLLVAGLKNLFKGRVRVFTFGDLPVYKQDRRFSSGMRMIGYKKVREYHAQTFPPTLAERFIFLFKAFVALGIGAYLGYMHLVWVRSCDLSDATTDSKTIFVSFPTTITAKHGVHLRAEPSEHSSVILTIPNHKSIQVADTSRSSEFISGEYSRWFQVDVDGKKGWVWENAIDLK